MVYTLSDSVDGTGDTAAERMRNDLKNKRNVVIKTRQERRRRTMEKQSQRNRKMNSKCCLQFVVYVVHFPMKICTLINRSNMCFCKCARAYVRACTH